ncbi:MAG: hypothetical protein ACE5OS_09150, partial [Anaerolineae bacterium]
GFVASSAERFSSGRRGERKVHRPEAPVLDGRSSIACSRRCGSPRRMWHQIEIHPTPRGH